MKTHKLTIPSLSALADMAEKTPGGESQSRMQADWYGATFKEALHMARHGWPEGTAQLSELKTRINVPVHQENFHSGTVSDVSGAYVDIGEYVQGTPECMIDFKPDTRPMRFAHIVVSGFLSAGFSVDAAMRRGIAIAAIVDTLETRGIRCSVDIVFASLGSSDAQSSVQITIPLKEAANPLNLDTLTFALAHPACFRRLIFAVEEQLPEEFKLAIRAVKHGTYGRPMPLAPIPDALIIPTADYTADWSTAGTQRYIAKALATFEHPPEQERS